MAPLLPRCGGDLYLEMSVGGTDVVCLQCGHILNRVQEATLRQRVKAGKN